jgi:single-strand DNA-binding protein
MASYNKVLLMGNLTRDPQLTYLPSNTPVVEFGIATNRRYKRQDGQQAEEVMFIDCRAYARTAEVINQYFQKGKPIFIEGRLDFDQWTDKEGHKRSKHRVFVENFQFVESRGSGGAPEGGGDYEGASSRAPRPAAAARGPATATSTPPPEPAPEMAEDDIPF